MALGLNVNSENEFQFWIIIIFDDKELTFFDSEIKMSCTGKPEDLKIKIYADSVNDVLSMKNYILNSVFQLFPKEIFGHYECIII